MCLTLRENRSFSDFWWFVILLDSDPKCRQHIIHFIHSTFACFKLDSPFIYLFFISSWRTSRQLFSQNDAQLSAPLLHFRLSRSFQLLFRKLLIFFRSASRKITSFKTQNISISISLYSLNFIFELDTKHRRMRNQYKLLHQTPSRRTNSKQMFAVKCERRKKVCFRSN